MILTVTLNPAIDHTLSLPEQLEDGTVARTENYRLEPGGKGINVSQYLRHLDVDTLTTGLVGGFTGEFVRTELGDEGLAHDFVEVDGRTRLNTTVLTPDEEYKVNHTGASVSDATVDSLVERILAHDPKVVVIGGSLPPGLDAGAIDRIATAGPWDAVVDVGGDVLAELDAEYALCKPNRSELAAATGLPTDTAEECREAVGALRDAGFERVVASLGGDGAIYADRERVVRADGLDVKVVDTVGAGDALLSGVLAALYGDGATPAEALRYGVAVASKLVAVPGTQVESLSDVGRLARDVDVEMDVRTERTHG